MQNYLPQLLDAFKSWFAFLHHDVFASEYKSQNSITKFRSALLSHALLMAFALMLGFAGYRFMRESFNVVVLITLLGGVGFLGLQIWLNVRQKIEYVAVLMASLMVIMGIMLMASGHDETAIYVWTYTIPMICVFTTGFKKGIALTLVYYVFTLYFFAHNYDFWASIGWSDYGMVRFIVVHLIVLELSSIADFVSCKLQDELYQTSTTDKLTGLSNRQKIEESLNHAVQQSLRFEQKCAISIFDIDNFKHINDHYGHLKGDEVLQTISYIITHNIRQIDSIGRWGGEEFFLILPNTDIATAGEILSRIKDAIAAHDFGFKVTCSFGLTLFEHDKSEDENINTADKALYAAKTSGKNKICLG